MNYENIELHNTVEIEPAAGGGIHLRRYPKAVRDCLSPLPEFNIGPIALRKSLICKELSYGLGVPRADFGNFGRLACTC